ncbi:nucleotidyltransferase domain-containing protein [Candidatus Peregrinibacteria bacterium]|nr:nucleotidyltransferase domain-containing protein [Candidatus Peregrinibacteria bacterium]
MPKNELKKIIRKYAEILKENRIQFKQIYLFGSYTTGKAHEWSDIDLAVVMDHVPRKGYLEQKMILRKLTKDADLRIEPILLEESDLKEKTASIMGYEVKKHGILVISG